MASVGIVGCGGVGSHLAYMISKDQDVHHLLLIDHDKVELKNLERQLFFPEDVGKYKSAALKRRLEISDKVTIIESSKTKIKTAADAAVLNGLDEVYVCTDSHSSKSLIHNLTKKGLKIGYIAYVGCEEHFIEYRSAMDSEDLNRWSLRDGYSTGQTFESNLMAAFLLYFNRGGKQAKRFNRQLTLEQLKYALFNSHSIVGSNSASVEKNKVYYRVSSPATGYVNGEKIEGQFVADVMPNKAKELNVYLGGIVKDGGKLYIEAKTITKGSSPKNYKKLIAKELEVKR